MPSGVCQFRAATSPPGADLAAAFAHASWLGELGNFSLMTGPHVRRAAHGRPVHDGPGESGAHNGGRLIIADRSCPWTVSRRGSPARARSRGVTGRDMVAMPGCGAIIGRRLSLEDTRNAAPGPSSNSISREFHMPTWREPHRLTK